MKLLTREEVETWPNGLTNHLKEIFPNGVSVIEHIKSLVLELIDENTRLKTVLDNSNIIIADLSTENEGLKAAPAASTSALEQWAIRAYTELLGKNLKATILVSLLTSLVKSRLPYDSVEIDAIANDIARSLGEPLVMPELRESMDDVCACGHLRCNHGPGGCSSPSPTNTCLCEGFKLLATE